METLTFLNGKGKSVRLNASLFKLILKTIGIPHLGTGMRLKLLLMALEKMKPLVKTCLDAGCGYGFVSFQLAKHGLNITALDSDHKRLSVAKKLNQILLPSVNFLKGSIYQLPFKDESFDLVVCLEVLEHLKNDKKALQEISRVTKNGGYTVISFPQYQQNIKDFKKLGHIRPGYHLSDLQEQASKLGLQLDSLYPYGRTPLGKLALNIDYYASLLAPAFAALLFPFLYPLLIIDSNLDAKDQPSNYLAVFRKI